MKRVAVTMSVSSFVAGLGLGIYLPVVTVFLVTVRRMDTVVLSGALILSGCLGLFSGLAIGRLTDRLGARASLLTSGTVTAGAIISLGYETSQWAIFILLGVLGVVTTAGDLFRGVVTTNAVSDAASATKLSMAAHSAFNAGFAGGLLVSGLIIARNRLAIYQSAFVVDAGTALIAAVTLAGVKQFPNRRNDSDVRLLVRPTRDYVAAGAVSGLTRMADFILTTGLPVWVVANTNVPRALAAWLLWVNTGLVVLLQVRLTRSADRPAGALKIQRRAFMAIAVGGLLLFVSSFMVFWYMDVLILVLAVVVVSLGEIWGEGAWWALRFQLAGLSSPGAFGGAFGIGLLAPTVFGPLLALAATRTRGVSWLGFVGVALVALVLQRRLRHPALQHSALGQVAPTALEP